jgi:hypothetical protein
MRNERWYHLHIKEIVYGDDPDLVVYEATDPTDNRYVEWFEKRSDAMNWIDSQVNNWEGEMENTASVYSYEGEFA